MKSDMPTVFSRLRLENSRSVLVQVSVELSGRRPLHECRCIIEIQIASQNFETNLT